MAPEITEYHARTASADVDTIEICPAFPDLMIYGTYSLAGKDREYEAQIRKGTIEVIPVSPMFQPAYPGMLLPKLAKKIFPAAVLDVQFHPKDKTLLGVALSNGKMHFFRFLRRGDVLGRRIITELLPLGHAVIGTADQHGLIPLITQFFWLPFIREVNRRDVSNILTVSVAATLSSNEAKVVKIRIPGIRSINDQRLARAPAELPVLSEDIHSHDLEAWTVACLPIHEFDGNFQYVLFSGGDDSKIIASMVEQDNCSLLDSVLTSPPVNLWSNRKIHSAGVTSILPLPIPQTPSQAHSSPIPLLTGSYDENIYLHTVAPHTYRLHPITSLSLRGGVWRLKLMDVYTLPLTHPAIRNNVGPTSRLKDAYYPGRTHYIILIACMHAGTKILRITYTPSTASKKPSTSPPEAGEHNDPNGNINGFINDNTNVKDDRDKNWAIIHEATFIKGHETLVYCSDFRKEWTHSDESPAFTSSITASATTSPPTSLSLAQSLATVSLGKAHIPTKKTGHIFARKAGKSGTKPEGGNGTGIPAKSNEKKSGGMARDGGGEGKIGLYTVVSASFYDRQICVWTWRDEERRKGIAL